MLRDTVDLADRALAGDSAARGEFLERMRPRLVLWAATRMSAQLRARVEPEDLAQEVLLALHADLDGFDGRADRSFFAWVFRVAENRIRDQAAYHGAQKRQTPEPRSFSQTSPSQAFARKEQAARLLRAIESLPEDYRSVSACAAFEERSVAETATSMQRSERAVRTLYWRALGRLRDALGEND